MKLWKNTWKTSETMENYGKNYGKLVKLWKKGTTVWTKQLLYGFNGIYGRIMTTKLTYNYV